MSWSSAGGHGIVADVGVNGVTVPKISRVR
jgi:hypothetical protein